MKPCRPFTAALLGIPLLANAAWGADMDSRTFIENAIKSNVAALSMAKLMQEKGTAKVQSLGRLIRSERTKANQHAFAVAKGENVSSAVFTIEGRSSVEEKLRKEPSNAFDTDVVNVLLQDTQNSIDTYQSAAATLHDAAGRYARDQLPALQKQLAAEQQTARSLGL